MLSAGGRSSVKGRNPGSPARVSEDSGAWAQWKQQLTAYVAWVNSQLKKKPGAHLVEDLRHDIRDGVALVDLVEIIGGERLEGVHPAPSNYVEMRDNVDKVLQFMTSHHIKMHHITTRDIIEGNLKAIMRLILALAAHYKPNSVRHSSQTASRQNITGIAQGAAAALTEARRHATKAGHRHRRKRQKEEHRGSHMFSDSDHGQRPVLCHNCRTSLVVPGTNEGMRGMQNKMPTHHRSSHISQRNSIGSLREMVEGEEGGRAELEGASGSSSPVNSHSTSPRMSLYLSDPPSSMEGLLASGGALMSASCESDSLTDSGFVEVRDSLKETHQLLLNLHGLLLNGDGDSDNFVQECIEGSNSQEKMIVLNERLLHAEELIGALRAELTKTKKDCMELQASKVGLEQRLTDKESQLTQAKTELMKLELEKQDMSLETDSLQKQGVEKEQLLSNVKLSFMKQLEEKDRVLADLRKEVMKRDQNIDGTREKLNYSDKSHGNGSHVVHASIHGSVKEDGAQTYKGASLSSSGRLDAYVKQMSGSKPAHLAGLKALRENMAQIRSSAPHQPEALDSLEENIVNLFEGMSVNGHSPVDTSLRNGRGGTRTTPTRTGASPREVQKTSPRDGQMRARGGRTKPVTPGRPTQPSGRLAQSSSGRGTDTTPRQTRPGGVPSATVGARSHIPVPNSVRGKNPNATSSDQQTQVVYYLNSSEKAHSCNIQKRLGEITLGDFRDLIADGDLYHFYFKVLDPEYGTVKEELSHDDDILPGWEGKIFAWLEEESGTVC